MIDDSSHSSVFGSFDRESVSLSVSATFNKRPDFSKNDTFRDCRYDFPKAEQSLFCPEVPALVRIYEIGHG